MSSNKPIYKMVEWMKDFDERMEKEFGYSKWDYISSNPNGIDLLRDNYEKINWYSLSLNENACELLEEHMNNIDWFYLSSNPNAIHMLKMKLIGRIYHLI